MDEPCTSNVDFTEEGRNADEADALPISQIKINPRDEGASTSGNQNTENDRSVVVGQLPGVEDIIAECEMRLKKYMKRRRLQRGPTEAANYNYFIDDESSNSSDGSISSSSENIFIDYNAPPPEYVTVTSAERKKKKEKLTIGSWLFLSNINGGWDYENTKNYLMTEFGVKCLKSRYVSNSLGMEGEYKAVIKFKSSEELNQVLKSLGDRNIHDKFFFFSYDKMPITYHDSDSDDDNISFGSLIPSPMGF